MCLAVASSRNAQSLQTEVEQGWVRSLHSLSPLELLLPDGKAKRTLSLGCGCPPPLVPQPCANAAAQADLIVLAPTTAECMTPTWLTSALQTLCSSLAPAGIAYVLVPRPWRPWVIRRLCVAGLGNVQPFLHLPDVQTSTFLIPLMYHTLQYALSALVPTRTWKRAVAVSLERVAGGRFVLSNLLPHVGFAVSRSALLSISGWVCQADEVMQPPHMVIIRTNMKATGSSAVLHCFDADQRQPSTVAKVSLSAQKDATRIAEAAALHRLGPHARAAGAHVPQLLRLSMVSNHPALLQTIVPGRAVSALIRARPQRLVSLMEQIARFVGTWNRRTTLHQRIEPERLTDELLSPAARLAPRLKEGHLYYAWLVAQCAQVQHHSLPLVATHNDLTVGNLLLDSHQRLGVVDWESGRLSDFPLMDFWYALTDAILAAHPTFDRPSAFRAWFMPSGAYALQVRRWQTRYFAQWMAHTTYAELCFHACWLRHASNEDRMIQPHAPRPFLGIVNLVAEHALMERTDGN